MRSTIPVPTSPGGIESRPNDEMIIVNSKQFEVKHIVNKAPKTRYRLHKRVESAEIAYSKNSQMDSAQQTSKRHL